MLKAGGCVKLSYVNNMIQHYIFANNDKEKDYVSIQASTLDGKTRVPLAQVKSAFADYSLIEWRLNVLVGKLLTLSDAAFADPVQRKAFKDQVRLHFADEFGFYGDNLTKGVIEDSLEPFEQMSDEEFDEWAKTHQPVDIDEVIAPGK